jgi:hypothetical protein|tara:strand:- start:7398 stop:7571 length:174 start_codon:yes stop_codon:yes gene_type:complete
MQRDLFINTELEKWWDVDIQNASVGELVKKGDKLADLTWSLLRENHKLNVDLLKLSK